MNEVNEVAERLLQGMVIGGVFGLLIIAGICFGGLAAEAFWAIQEWRFQ